LWNKTGEIMTDKIKCPKCGHDEVNVAIWGSANIKSHSAAFEDDFDQVSINVDHTKMNIKKSRQN